MDESGWLFLSQAHMWWSYGKNNVLVRGHHRACASSLCTSPGGGDGGSIPCLGELYWFVWLWVVLVLMLLICFLASYQGIKLFHDVLGVGCCCLQFVVVCFLLENISLLHTLYSPISCLWQDIKPVLWGYISDVMPLSWCWDGNIRRDLSKDFGCWYTSLHCEVISSDSIDL